MATNPLLKQALAQVNPVIQSQVAPVNQAYNQSAATMKAGYQALADLQRGVAPQIQQTYNQAASNQAGFAKGFSDALRAHSEGTAGSLNEFLQSVAGGGAPVQSQFVNGGSDALYATGGYIPASSLNREGAAFTAAAQQRPAQALGLGVDAVKAANIQRLQALREIQGKKPALLQDALNSLRDFNLKSKAQALNEQLAAKEFGLKVSKASTDAAYKSATLKQRQQQSEMNNYFKGQNLTLSQKRIGIQAAKLNLDARKVANAEKKLSTSPKKGGFTALQRKNMMADAYDTVKDAFDNRAEGLKDELGNILIPPNMKPVDILRDLVGHGIPFSIAVRQLAKFYPVAREWYGPGLAKARAAQKKKG